MALRHLGFWLVYNDLAGNLMYACDDRYMQLTGRSSQLSAEVLRLAAC